MNEYIFYLLKASLGITVFYMVFWFTLRRETFFKVNRLFLIGSLLASLILPFIVFNYTTHASFADTKNVFVELNKNFHSIPGTTIPTASAENGINWQNTLLIVYITGLLIFSLRLIWQCIDLIILASKNNIHRVNGLNIIENNKYGLPFSFFNLIFINPKFHSGTDLTNILAHERVHIREHHWFDLFLVELATVIFWFNPFVWLLERSIKQNHEYLADEGVLAQGLSVGQYQAILINQIMGMQIIGLTNNLNYSLNKKRMSMMTKTKTPKARVYKILWALPATALILLAFAEPAYVMESKANPTNVATQIINDQTIQFTGKVVDGTGTPLNGASIVVYGGTTGASSDKDGLFSLKMDRSDQICISYVGYTTQKVSGSEIEYKLQKNPNIPVTFTLVIGAIKLDIDEIIKNGKTEEASENKSIKKDDEIFVAVEELPTYPGGMYAFAKEITEKISNLKPSGKITVEFTVDEMGKSQLQYASGSVSSDLPLVFFNLKKWTPGKQRGKAVPVNYSFELTFK